MHRTDFGFDLPQELIAQEPLADRSASRLLEVNGNTGVLSHRLFAELPDLLSADDLLVFNNTRVIPARLYAQKQTGGRVEVLIERLLSDGSALAHIRASKPPKEQAVLFVTADAESDITELSMRILGRRNALYHVAPESGSLREAMRRYGHIPLPPYIDRPDVTSDRERYQTVYARREGAVAAPTAGLHFDQPLLNRLAAQGVSQTEVTLHVGAGTFQPVRVDDIAEHQMHREVFEVEQHCCDAIKACRQRGGRVVAVGTTALRALESVARLADNPSDLKAYSGETDIFLYPGSEFLVVDALVTNFHLPESTLMMLVSAFAGLDNIRHAYQLAIENRYRFFSYGDAMFLTRGSQP